ncbi:MAG: hypothetical protein HYR94_02850 [Chloroflexi bacterium]|nr:hypothetical protein [Chloroflexota bacterium]
MLNTLGDEIETDLTKVSDQAEAETLDRQMREAWDAAMSFYFPREYLKRDGSYDTQRQLGEAMSEAARQNDLNPTPHFTEADQMQVKSNWLVVIITGLAVALLCFTLVESAHSIALKYILITVGIIIMLTGIGATIAVEYNLFA